MRTFMPATCLRPSTPSGGVKIFDTGRLQPIGTPNVYYSSKSVSDMQLLIADLEGHQPGQIGFALLSQVGYFPGNLTLFDQIRRIPFRATLDLGTWSIASAPSDLPVANDDDAVPPGRRDSRVDDSFVSLSGGVDSRLVLGCVRKAGIRPRLLHTGTARIPSLNPSRLVWVWAAALRGRTACGGPSHQSGRSSSSYADDRCPDHLRRWWAQQMEKSLHAAHDPSPRRVRRPHSEGSVFGCPKNPGPIGDTTRA